MQTTIEQLAEIYLQAMIDYDASLAVDVRIKALELGYDLVWRPRMVSSLGVELRAESIEIICSYDVHCIASPVYRVVDMANSCTRLLD